MSANRLTVACCMRESGAATAAVVVVVEAPGPLDRAGAEHQRPARVPVERQVVGRRRRTRRSSRSRCSTGRVGDGGRRQPERARRPEAVVGVLVPLVAERAVGERGGRARRRAWRCSCCARSASCRRRPARGSRSSRPSLTMNSWPVSAFSGRPPSAGGLKRGSRQVPVQTPGSRVDLGVRVRLLVGDQRAVRCAGAVDARLPARLPEDLVAAEEGQVHAGGARRLDVGALAARPVLVVADREERLVLEQLGAAPIGCRRRSCS